MATENNGYYYELSEEWTAKWAKKFRPLYDYLVKNPKECDYHNYKYIVHYNQIQKLVNDFPFIKDIPNFDINDKTHFFGFLTLNGKNKKSWTPHIDPGSLKWDITLPLLNCTDESTTSWVEPIAEKTRANTEDIKIYEGKYKLLAATQITNKALVLRGDIMHKVDVHHERDETRVVVKISVPNLELDDVLNAL